MSKPLALLCAATLLAACSGAEVKSGKLNRFGRPLKAGTPVPSWVDHPPESTRQRYVSVGFSPPTFWPQDSISNASEDARGKLALALSSHVEAFGAHASSNHGERGQLDLTKEATDLVVQNSRIEATWCDEEGTRAQAGTTWALAAIDLRPGASGSGPESSNGGGGNRMPGWLDRLPSTPARMYAAGYSGPTFSADDSLQYAGDAAVQNLAASLRSHVQAYQLLIETKSGMSIDDFAHADDPDAAFLEIVRKSSRVEQVWVDEEGARPGDPPGAVWALASIDVGSKGGYQAQANDALGPALDGHGNVPVGVKDEASGPTLVQQVAAHAAQAQAATQAKAEQSKKDLSAHDAEVKKALEQEQGDYRKATQQGAQPEGAGPAQPQ